MGTGLLDFGTGSELGDSLNARAEAALQRQRLRSSLGGFCVGRGTGKHRSAHTLLNGFVIPGMCTIDRKRHQRIPSISVARLPVGFDGFNVTAHNIGAPISAAVQ